MGASVDSHKKSKSGNILSVWGEAPAEPIETIIYMVGALADLITFQDDIFRGYYDFTGGRISLFPIDFYMGLTTAALLRCL